jgi:phage/plasmid-like protein (TIGR03299 family)
MHNINGTKFVYRGEPAWHGIGTPLLNGETCVQAVKQAHADFQVIKAPATFEVTTSTGVIYLPVPGKIELVKTPTKHFPGYASFGRASEDYTIIQNMEIAESLDTLTDKWPCETVGVLGEGETLFIVLDAGEMRVGRDLVRQYFLVTDTKDGGTSLKIAFTPVRTVCKNTLVTGLKSAVVTVSMAHSENLKKAFTGRIEMIGKLEKTKNSTMEMFQALDKLKLSTDNVEEVLNATYPVPKRPAKTLLLDEEYIDVAQVGALYEEATAAQATWEYYCKRTEVLKSTVRDLFGNFNDEQPHSANTGWALYNSVVESADYREGALSVTESSIWGVRASEKKRAFASIVSFVK